MPEVDPDELALWERSDLIHQQPPGVVKVCQSGGNKPTLTKRDELSFLIVLAFPNASMAGLASMI